MYRNSNNNYEANFESSDIVVSNIIIEKNAASTNAIAKEFGENLTKLMREHKVAKQVEIDQFIIDFVEAKILVNNDDETCTCNIYLSLDPAFMDKQKLLASFIYNHFTFHGRSLEVNPSQQEKRRRGTTAQWRGKESAKKASALDLREQELKDREDELNKKIDQNRVEYELKMKEADDKIKTSKDEFETYKWLEGNRLQKQREDFEAHMAKERGELDKIKEEQSAKLQSQQNDLDTRQNNIHEQECANKDEKNRLDQREHYLDEQETAQKAQQVELNRAWRDLRRAREQNSYQIDEFERPLTRRPVSNASSSTPAAADNVELSASEINSYLHINSNMLDSTESIGHTNEFETAVAATTAAANNIDESKLEIV